MFSKITDDLLSVCINKYFKRGREDIIPENNFLQFASISLNKVQTFKPHQHFWKGINYKKTISQIAWVI